MELLALIDQRFSSTWFLQPVQHVDCGRVTRGSNVLVVVRVLNGVAMAIVIMMRRLIGIHRIDRAIPPVTRARSRVRAPGRSNGGDAVRRETEGGRRAFIWSEAEAK